MVYYSLKSNNHYNYYNYVTSILGITYRSINRMLN